MAAAIEAWSSPASTTPTPCSWTMASRSPTPRVTITGMPAARYSANRVGAEAILENEDLIRHRPMSPANSSSGTAWGATERTDAG